VTVESHPEEWLERDRRGLLTPQERSSLGAHLATCSECALEHALAKDFDAFAPVIGIESAVVDRIVASVLSEVAPAAPSSPPHAAAASKPSNWPAGLKTGFKSTLALIVFGAVGFGSGAGALHLLRGTTVEPAQAGVREASPTNEKSAPKVATVLPSKPVPSAPAVVTPPVRAASAQKESPAPLEVQAPVPSAAELLELGNTARRSGNMSEAEGYYAKLQALYPDSREALVSRVGWGRMLLDSSSNAEGALRQFDEYLLREPDGTMGEEVRLGRALALGRLGRANEERVAWENFLEHHPASAHRERALARLQALSSP
jgi:anti-sigma factor RsiW